LRTFLTQIGPAVPLTSDPPVVCFWEWIGWKDYEVPRIRNLESVSAKILIFFHHEVALPAAVPTQQSYPIPAWRHPLFLFLNLLYLMYTDVTHLLPLHDGPRGPRTTRSGLQRNHVETYWSAHHLEAAAVAGRAARGAAVDVPDASAVGRSSLALRMSTDAADGVIAASATNTCAGSWCP
jgi:hypothetical protein